MAYNDSHPGAHRYESAIQARIKENARKGRSSRWMAENPERSVLIEKMNNSSNSFIQKMLTSFFEWGSLTDGQEKAVINIFSKDEERKAGYKAADANSKFVGTVTVRQEFTLTMKSYTSFESDFGLVHIYIFKDQEDNVVVYKGSTNIGCIKGEVVKGKATVKAHNVREGINQTLISRPKFEIVR